MLEPNSSMMLKIWKAAFVFEREYGIPETMFEQAEVDYVN